MLKGSNCNSEVRRKPPTRRVQCCQGGSELFSVAAPPPAPPDPLGSPEGRGSGTLQSSPSLDFPQAASDEVRGLVVNQASPFSLESISPL